MIRMMIHRFCPNIEASTIASASHGITRNTSVRRIKTASVTLLL